MAHRSKRWLPLVLSLHHLVIRLLGHPPRRCSVAVFVIVVVVATVEVHGAFVLVGAAMLCQSIYVKSSSKTSSSTHVLVSPNQITHVCRGVFVQLLVVSKNKYRHVDRAKDRELVGLLKQTTFSFQERPILFSGLVLNCLMSVSNPTYTERFLSSLMALISIFLRPMVGYVRA